jgi:hypothetical protein
MLELLQEHGGNVGVVENVVGAIENMAANPQGKVGLHEAQSGLVFNVLREHGARSEICRLCSDILEL